MNYGTSESKEREQNVQESENNYYAHWNNHNQYSESVEDNQGNELGEAPYDTNSEEYKKWYIKYCKYYYGYDYSEYYGVPENEDEDMEDETEDQKEEVNAKGKKKGKRKIAAPKPQEEAKWFEMEESKNTNVYVSGLPTDITDEEYKDLMSKYGMILYDPVKKCPKIKLYQDENGYPKGDGRCCYIKVESVDLAIKLLDGYKLRGHTIHVEKAKFTMKGEYDPAKKRKKLTNKEKKKMKEKQEKLFDWRPERPVNTRLKSEKVVILKHMFSPSEFDEDPMLINELRDEVRSEAAKFGEVKNVKIYDNHPEGVMSIAFKEHESADSCVTAFNGRWFAKKKISAETWDGRTKYDIQETEAEREARLAKWNSFLEKEDKNESSSSVDLDSTNGEKIQQNNDENKETVKEADVSLISGNTDSTSVHEKSAVITSDDMSDRH